MLTIPSFTTKGCAKPEPGSGMRTGRNLKRVVAFPTALPLLDEPAFFCMGACADAEAHDMLAFVAYLLMSLLVLSGSERPSATLRDACSLLHWICDEASPVA